MKREHWALLLLLLLVAAAWLNIISADRLTALVEDNLSRVERAANRGDFEAALTAFETAYQIWESHASYTQSFLRHPDVDAAAESFFSLQGVLEQGDSAALSSALRDLRYRLETIDRMERPWLGSIF